ncbi:hypothetical protein RDABS01_035572 [Bienertia sinuspersici]
MTSRNKDAAKEVFKWSDKNTYILCEWKEIQTEVEKKIGHPLNNSNSCKHKYDTMIRDWRYWRDLKRSETGLGWDPISGKIDASDEWWKIKIKFKKFRQRGVNSTLEEYWIGLFGDSCATGDNVYIPAIEPIEDFTTENENTEDEYTGVENSYRSTQFSDALLTEENFLDNFMEQARNSENSNNLDDGSQVNNEGVNIRTSKKVQKQPMTKDINSQINRTKRQSGGSAMVARGISEMTECVKRLNHGSSLNVSTISKALQIINHMVGDFILEKHSDLWCHANKREIFIKMEDDESRLQWLKYLYDRIDNWNYILNYFC